jgi:hypothetical protein
MNSGSVKAGGVPQSIEREGITGRKFTIAWACRSGKRDGMRASKLEKRLPSP